VSDRDRIGWWGPSAPCRHRRQWCRRASDTYLPPIWHVSDTHLLPIWHVSDTYLTRIWHLSDTYLTRIWHQVGVLIQVMKDHNNESAIMQLTLSALKVSSDTYLTPICHLERRECQCHQCKTQCSHLPHSHPPLSPATLIYLTPIWHLSDTCSR